MCMIIYVYVMINHSKQGTVVYLSVGLVIVVITENT